MTEESSYIKVKFSILKRNPFKVTDYDFMSPEEAIKIIEANMLLGKQTG